MAVGPILSPIAAMLSMVSYTMLHLYILCLLFSLLTCFKLISKLKFCITLKY